MGPEPGPVLEYATPGPPQAGPRPVGYRALVVGATLAAVGAVAALCGPWLPGRLGAVATAAFVMACAGLVAVSLVAGCETLFFPGNVTDHKRAVLATALNLCGVVALVALRNGLRG